MMKIKINYIFIIIIIAVIAIGGIKNLSPANNAYGYTYKIPTYVSSDYLASYDGEVYDKYYHTRYRGINVFVEKGVSVSKYNELISYMAETNETLFESSPDIYLTYNSIRSTLKGYDVPYSDEEIQYFLGLTFNKKTIGEIKRIVFISQVNMTSNVYYHELWHCYDFSHNLPSTTTEFQNLVEGFANEANCYEDFASSGEIYSSVPEILKEFNPEIYDYFDNLLN